MTAANTGQFATINGLELYYEIHGTGPPLLLLHGGFGVAGMFAQMLPQLAQTRQVIAVELQGHGHTADIDRPLSYQFMADDIGALLTHLGQASSDILGYSLGGGVALQTAIRHPELVRKLVVVSAPYASDGWYAEVRAGMLAMNAELAATWIGSPMHQAYTAVAPKPQDWTTLAAKTGQMLGQDYDWSADVAAIELPAMIVVGDADSMHLEHVVQFFQLLGGGQKDAGWDGSGMSTARLAILPAATHYNILSSPLLLPIVTNFLDAAVPDNL